MLQPILTMLPWLGMYLRSRIPAVRRRPPLRAPSAGLGERR